MTIAIKTILQKNLFPLGVDGTTIDKIVQEIDLSDSVSVKLRDFRIEYIDTDGKVKSVPLQAANDVEAWREFKRAHNGLEPTKILDVE